tara:strand:+ start:274 stop:525 length:252 start_codon:yes stop_codon:yes gene_type:complete
VFVLLAVFVANEVVLLVPCVVLFVNPVELVNAVFLLVFVFLEVLFVNPVEFVNEVFLLVLVFLEVLVDALNDVEFVKLVANSV